MLRLGKLTDYAILIMSAMAKDPHATLSATSLADTLHLSVPTVSKVLKMLGDADLVNSVRGAEGGYHLARSAHKISIADVIVAMEGELAMTECCEKINACAIHSMCMLKENWRKINGMIHSFLARLTIIDMLEPLSSRQLLQGLNHDK